MKNIGQRIRFFRKKKKLSQFDLELEINAAMNSLSRIELGKITPSYSTLKKIASALDLSSEEQSYLFGINAKPVNSREISRAIDEAYPSLYKKKLFCYLIDDRARLVAISEPLNKLFKLFRIEILDKKNPKPGFEILIDKKSPLTKGMTKHKHRALIKKSITKTVGRFPNLLDDEIFGNYIKRLIKEYPFIEDIWQDIKEDKTQVDLSDWKESFKLFGIEIQYTIINEKLINNPRFNLIHLVPNNLTIKKILELAGYKFKK